MADQPTMRIDKGFFASREDVYRDMAKTGFWPTTYISGASPELPLHWHDGDIIGYLMDGETYVLDGAGKHCPLTPGDRLVIPAGALHAEGEVTDPVTYIVTVERCEPFLQALRILDPQTYPDPRLLALDPDLAVALGAPPPA